MFILICKAKYGSTSNINSQQQVIPCRLCGDRWRESLQQGHECIIPVYGSTNTVAGDYHLKSSYLACFPPPFFAGGHKIGKVDACAEVITCCFNNKFV